MTVAVRVIDCPTCSGLGYLMLREDPAQIEVWQRAESGSVELRPETLGEAIQTLRPPHHGCACIGGPDCCTLRYQRSRIYQAAANQVANHLNALISLRRAECSACNGVGWLDDPSACGDPEHCYPVYLCSQCNPGGEFYG